MKKMADDSIDSIVTDPPYELGFMGKSWDATGIAFNVDTWREALRVLKPGGHLIAFSGSRTYHRMAVAIEDAGFEIRDQIMWVYGSGFPKSHNISKGIDKAAGAERIETGLPNNLNSCLGGSACQCITDGTKFSATKHAAHTAPATPAAKQWDGWGTALKPAHEPMVLARKPVIGTVANNVLTYGVGGLNIDGARVGSKGGTFKASKPKGESNRIYGEGINGTVEIGQLDLGRWPANFIHDGSDEVVALFPQTKGTVGNTQYGSGTNSIYGKFSTDGNLTGSNGTPDSGSAARFFYCAKASKRDRNEGLDGFEAKQPVNGANKWTEQDKRLGEGVTHIPSANHHPTVKPTTLMQYLVRLVTPPGGTVLDPFMGSGSTGKACAYENFKFVGIDMQIDYLEIAKARINAAIKNAKRSGNNNQHDGRLSSVLSDTSNDLSIDGNSCNAIAKPTNQRNLYSSKSNTRLFDTPGFRQMELF